MILSFHSLHFFLDATNTSFRPLLFDGNYNSFFSPDHPFSPPRPAPESDDMMHESTPHLTTSRPTQQPTNAPSNHPTLNPTQHPTKQPTEKWSNSPQKTKSDNYQKKKSKKKIDDDQLLQTALMKQSNDTLIKLYLFQNHSNIDFLTKFQNQLISQHRHDLIMITDFRDIDRLSQNVRWISKQNQRVTTYRGQRFELMMIIHRLVDILESIQWENQKDIYIAKINRWFFSVIDRFHEFKLGQEWIDMMDSLLTHYAHSDNKDILHLLDMIQRSYGYGAHLFHLDDLNLSYLSVIISFFSSASSIVYDSKYNELLDWNTINMNKSF